VEHDRPWPAPTPYVVVGRKWKYAPPPWVMHEALVEDLDRWLVVQDPELRPRVAASGSPRFVLLKPWVDPAVSAVELMIEKEGCGSRISVLAYGDVPQLPGDARRRVRYRLGTIFGAALRDWVDEPHN
jgi:hypothetical protein